METQKEYDMAIALLHRAMGGKPLSDDERAVVAKFAQPAFYYAKNVTKKRFPDGEHAIMESDVFRDRYIALFARELRHAQKLSHVRGNDETAQ